MAGIGKDHLEHLKAVHFYYWEQYESTSSLLSKDEWEAKAEDVAAIISFYEPEWKP